MSTLIAIPTLIVDTDEGLCVVKVCSKDIEMLFLHIIGTWLMSGEASLIKLPSHMKVTGNIVSSELKGQQHDK